MTCDMWLVTCERWHVTHDTCHVRCCGGQIFSQNFLSLALTVCDLWYFEDLEGRADWLTESSMPVVKTTSPARHQYNRQDSSKIAMAYKQPLNLCTKTSHQIPLFCTFRCSPSTTFSCDWIIWLDSSSQTHYCVSVPNFHNNLSLPNLCLSLHAN